MSAPQVRPTGREVHVPAHEVRWMFHSTAMVADYDLAVDLLGALVGLEVLEYGESTEPGIGRRGGMAWLGDNSIEIGQPLGEGAATTFVTRLGGGVHSIALQVADLEATMAHLAAHGVRIAARPRPEMCFSDPRDTSGIFLQWSCFALDVDPRFGAPVPTPSPSTLAPALRHAFVGALVEEPFESAARLAALLGTRVTFEDSGAGPDAPGAGVSLGDCTLALYRRPDARTGAGLWGRVYDRPRTHLVAVSVDDLASARQALRASGVTVVRDAGDLLVIDPADTAGVQLGLTDRLLPGDPRA